MKFLSRVRPEVDRSIRSEFIEPSHQSMFYRDEYRLLGSKDLILFCILTIPYFLSNGQTNFS
jgi:hypothetical protein